MNLRPVFIAGCDRSGTTMLGNILGAAPEAAATPESQFIHELLLLMHIRAFSSPLDAAKWLQNQFRYAVWDMQCNTEELATLIELAYPRQTVINLVNAYFNRFYDDESRPKVWVDHTPDNFKHSAVLAHYFPEAYFIHIVRDGRAVYHSVKNLDWGPNNAYAATRFWAERLQQALSAEISAESRCVRVRYEDILQRPEQRIAELCNAVGLPYQNCMLTGNSLDLPRFTRHQHLLVGNRPDLSRANIWQEKLSQREIGEFEAYPWSRTLLEAMGYELYTKKPMKISFITMLLRYVHNYISYFINRLKHRRTEKLTLQRYKGL